MYEPIYFQFGSYQTEIELLTSLFLDGENQPPRLKKESDQGWTLNSLANSYSLIGQPRRAVPVYQNAVLLAEKEENKKNTAIGLGAMASTALLSIGALRDAERNLRPQIDLSHEIENEDTWARGCRELGRVLSYRGAWQEADAIHDKGIELARKEGHKQLECVIMAYSAHRAYLMKNYPLSIEKGQIAKKLADIPFSNLVACQA